MVGWVCCSCSCNCSCYPTRAREKEGGGCFARDKPEAGKDFIASLTGIQSNPVDREGGSDVEQSDRGFWCCCDLRQLAQVAAGFAPLLSVRDEEEQRRAWGSIWPWQIDLELKKESKHGLLGLWAN